MGRPSKYEAKYHVPWASSLAMEGLDDQTISDRMGIAKSTLNKWKAEHEEFSEALKRSKEIADSEVEQSLFKRATGYRTKEKRVIITMDADGNQKPARIETFEKEVPPDTTAQIYWLKNRKRDKWKDKWDVEVNTDKSITFNVVGVKADKKNT